MKVTPQHDLSWYVKWASAAMIMTAIVIRSSDTAGAYSLYDLTFSLLGTLGWLSVGLLWHDRALIVLNASASMALATGITNHLL